MRPSLLWIATLAVCLQSMQVLANDTNVLMQTGAVLEQSMGQNEYWNYMEQASRPAKAHTHSIHKASARKLSTHMAKPAETGPAKDVHLVAFDQDEYDTLTSAPLAGNTPNEHDVTTSSWVAGVDAGLAVVLNGGTKAKAKQAAVWAANAVGTPSEQEVAVAKLGTEEGWHAAMFRADAEKQAAMASNGDIAAANEAAVAAVKDAWMSGEGFLKARAFLAKSLDFNRTNPSALPEQAQGLSEEAHQGVANMAAQYHSNAPAPAPLAKSRASSPSSLATKSKVQAKRPQRQTKRELRRQARRQKKLGNVGNAVGGNQKHHSRNADARKGKGRAIVPLDEELTREERARQQIREARMEKAKVTR